MSERSSELNAVPEPVQQLSGVMDVMASLSAEQPIGDYCSELIRLLGERCGYQRISLWLEEGLALDGHSFWGMDEWGHLLDGPAALEQCASYGLFHENPQREVRQQHAMVRSGDGVTLGSADYLAVSFFAPGGERLGVLCMDNYESQLLWSRADLSAVQWLGAYLGTVLGRKKVDADLAKRQELLREVIDSIPHYIYVKDAQSRFLLVNQMQASANGAVKPEEMLGKSDFDYYEEALARKYYEDEQRLIASKEPMVNVEERCRDHQGRERWLLTTKIPVLNADGEFVCLVGTGADITELKQAKDQLEASEERFRVIAEVAGDAILLYGAAGQIQYANRAAETIFGYSREQLLAMSPQELMWDNIRHPSGTKDTFIQMGKNGAGEAFPIEMSRADVTVCGEPCQVMIVRDVSEREAALKGIRELTAAIEQSADGFIISDEKGLITYVNPGYEAITGYCKEDVVHKMWITTQDHDPAAPNSFFELDLRQVENWKVSRKATRCDGAVYDEEVSTFAIYNEAREICNYVTIIRDVSEERSLETELRQAQKLESVGQLAAGIAHEINTPIQFVGDNIQFLKDAIDDLLGLQAVEQELLEAARQVAVSEDLVARVEEEIGLADLDYLKEELPRALEQSLEGVKRVSTIVRAMKEFAHPGTTEHMPADLNEAIQTTVTVARNEWKYVSQLHLELEEGLPLVSCLVGEINQVLLNLIVNARDAIADKVGDSGGQGNITIRTAHVDDAVEIRVEDDGGGIPEAIRNQIFDPFFTTKEVGRGSGQGLAISHGVVVKKHGGEFFFESTEGVGTCFVIRLPLIPS